MSQAEPGNTKRSCEDERRFQEEKLNLHHIKMDYDSLKQEVSRYGNYKAVKYHIIVKGLVIGVMIWS